MCIHLGEGEGPRLGHAAPPPFSVPPRALCLSLLLPAVTGVPSPRATDPPSHVRPLFFPCVKPAAPFADSVPISPYPCPDLEAHPYLFEVPVSRHPPFMPKSTRSPSVQASPQIPSRISLDDLPDLDSPLCLLHPAEGGRAELGSDRVTCPFSLQLDGPPAVALGQCPLVGPGPMHRRHLLLPARVRPAAHARPSRDPAQLHVPQAASA